ncbi:MAG: O-acetylhomoserine aminocarboxypropyltransferase/cysteine synthase family protein [Vampirovibrionales bacterium]
MTHAPLPTPPPSFETQALHAGYTPDATGARAIPLHQTTSYVFNSTEHAAHLFALKAFGNIYTRLMNPTTDAFEQRVAALEGGIAGLAFASGHAAISGTLLTLAQAGDHIVSSTDLYGGTHTLLQHTLPKLGIHTTFVSPAHLEENLAQWEAAIQPNTKALFVETFGNPKLEVVDIAALAELAHRHGLPLVVDNTLATPYLCNPIAHGADIVVHSATKFIGGQGLSLGGVVVDAGTFDWQASGRFPSFVDPDPEYNGLPFWETFGNLTFILRARVHTLRNFGGTLSPFNAWTFLNGLETLALRIEKHSRNALHLATWLQQHPYVAWVNYPGLSNNPAYALAQQYLPKGQGALLGFGVKGGATVASQVINHVKLFSHVANLGDSKSLILHPASTSHSQLTAEAQAASGVTPDYIRLSVGLEAVDDLIADLDQAIHAAVQAGAVVG